MGLMAFVAGGAQANWLVLDPEGTTMQPDVTLSAKTHKEFVLLVAAQNLEILCLKVETDPSAPLLLLAASTVAHGHVIFTECKTFVKKVLSEGCKPVEPILAGGLAELILHPANGPSYILIKPLTGLPFTILKFNAAKCALPEENEVGGDLVAECGKLEPVNTFVNVDCKTHEVTHLLQQAPQALFPTAVLTFGENPALLHGIVDTLINSPALYIGKKWGGDAP